MKLERLHIATFVGVAAAVWLIVLTARGISVTWDHAAPFSIVVSVLVLLGLLLELTLWRQPWLHGWFIKRPDLRGTWCGEIQSSYVRPGSASRVPPIACYMVVKQTLSSLQMHLMTAESESWLIAERVRSSPNGAGYQIIGVYTNEPDIHLRDSRVSEMHQGAILLDTHGPSRKPSTMTAKYWTDRKTTGTIDFTARVAEVTTRFADAAKACEAAAASLEGT